MPTRMVSAIVSGVAAPEPGRRRQVREALAALRVERRGRRRNCRRTACGRSGARPFISSGSAWISSIAFGSRSASSRPRARALACFSCSCDDLALVECRAAPWCRSCRAARPASAPSRPSAKTCVTIRKNQHRPRHRRVQFLDAVPLVAGGQMAGVRDRVPLLPWLVLIVEDAVAASIEPLLVRGPEGIDEHADRRARSGRTAPTLREADDSVSWSMIHGSPPPVCSRRFVGRVGQVAEHLQIGDQRVHLGEIAGHRRRRRGPVVASP